MGHRGDPLANAGFRRAQAPRAAGSFRRCEGCQAHGLMFKVVLRADKKRADLATSPVKGSLNLKVSKGPEETTCRNQRLLKIST
jgi:hypothetical protein